MPNWRQGNGLSASWSLHVACIESSCNFKPQACPILKAPIHLIQGAGQRGAETCSAGLDADPPVRRYRTRTHTTVMPPSLWERIHGSLSCVKVFLPCSLAKPKSYSRGWPGSRSRTVKHPRQKRPSALKPSGPATEAHFRCSDWGGGKYDRAMQTTRDGPGSPIVP